MKEKEKTLAQSILLITATENIHRRSWKFYKKWILNQRPAVYYTSTLSSEQHVWDVTIDGFSQISLLGNDGFFQITFLRASIRLNLARFILSHHIPHLMFCLVCRANSAHTRLFISARVEWIRLVLYREPLDTHFPCRACVKNVWFSILDVLPLSTKASAGQMTPQVKSKNIIVIDMILFLLNTSGFCTWYSDLQTLW